MKAQQYSSCAEEMYVHIVIGIYPFKSNKHWLFHKCNTKDQSLKDLEPPIR